MREPKAHFFFVFAQRALTAATILALASGLRLRFFFGTALAGAGVAFSPLTRAHRAFCAATILARPSADIPPFLRFASGVGFAAAFAVVVTGALAGAAAGAASNPLLFAQRSFWASAILALAAGDIVRLPFVTGSVVWIPPSEGGVGPNTSLSTSSSSAMRLRRCKAFSSVSMGWFKKDSKSDISCTYHGHRGDRQ